MSRIYLIKKTPGFSNVFCSGLAQSKWREIKYGLWMTLDRIDRSILFSDCFQLFLKEIAHFRDDVRIFDRWLIECDQDLFTTMNLSDNDRFISSIGEPRLHIDPCSMCSSQSGARLYPKGNTLNTPKGRTTRLRFGTEIDSDSIG